MNRRDIITEDPDKTLWWRLGHFKNVERVAPLIRAHHNTEANAKKQARQIRYCLEQAEEYFQSAQAVTVATKPLLLYYGMASLAWALILLKKTGDYALERLPPEHHGHGLEPPRFQYGDRNLALPEMLEAIRSKVSPLFQGQGQNPELRGTFGLLYSVVGHEPAGIKQVIRRPGVTTTSTTFCFISDGPPAPQDLAGRSLTLGGLLLQIPDMASSFGELGIRPPLAFCSEAKIEWGDGDPNQRFSLAIARCTPEEIGQLRARFPERPGVKFWDAPGGFVCEIVYARDSEVEVPHLFETADGRLYFYISEAPEPLPESCAFLGSMFLLGMLVRYYPHVWMQLLERRHPLVEVVEAFITIAERKYPNMILNNLSGESFVFRHA